MDNEAGNKSPSKELESQSVEQDSQELLTSQDYPLTQQVSDGEQQEQETGSTQNEQSCTQNVESSEDEDNQSLASKQIAKNNIFRRLDRGNHKCCIAALQYTLDYTTVDLEDVGSFIRDVSKNKKTLVHSSQPYHEQQGISVQDVTHYLEWVDAGWDRTTNDV
jgi:hypothetical protein